MSLESYWVYDRRGIEVREYIIFVESSRSFKPTRRHIFYTFIALIAHGHISFYLTFYASAIPVSYGEHPHPGARNAPITSRNGNCKYCFFAVESTKVCASISKVICLFAEEEDDHCKLHSH